MFQIIMFYPTYFHINFLEPILSKMEVILTIRLLFQLRAKGSLKFVWALPRIHLDSQAVVIQFEFPYFPELLSNILTVQTPQVNPNWHGVDIRVSPSETLLTLPLTIVYFHQNLEVEESPNPSIRSNFGRARQWGYTREGFRLKLRWSSNRDARALLQRSVDAVSRERLTSRRSAGWTKMKSEGTILYIFPRLQLYGRLRNPWKFWEFCSKKFMWIIFVSYFLFFGFVTWPAEVSIIHRWIIQYPG